jgi:hypothetical protein
VIHQFPSRIARTVERQLHGWFDGCRTHGEWFTLDQDQVALVVSLSACHGLDELPEPLRSYSRQPAPYRKCGASVEREGERFQGYFPDEVMAELERRAKEADRTMVAEVVRTLRQAWGITEQAPPPPPPEKPKRPRGRPRKEK